MLRIRITLLLFTVLLFTFGCRLRKLPPDPTIAAHLKAHTWEVMKVIDHFYGETNYYYGDNKTLKTAAEQLDPSVHNLQPFKVKLSFNKDSSYSESEIPFNNNPDPFGRKWTVKKGMLKLPTSLPKNNYDPKPVLYGELKVITCNDSLVMLIRSVDKTKWTRTFILAR